MIKRIQLRGMSRTPSDRMNEDGGCAESLNVQFEAGELAPAMGPKNVTAEICGITSPSSMNYIHKLPSGKEIYVGLGGTSSYSVVAYTGGSSVTVSGAPSTGTIYDYSFSSVGNILIEYVTGYGSNTKHYYLYKNNQYTYLGNELPKPNIEFVTKKYTVAAYANCDIASRDGDGYKLRTMGGNTGTLTDAQKVALWRDAKNEGNVNHASLLETMSLVWEKVTMRIAELRSGGTFVAPFFIRYALRMYDGSYVHTSVPILCGAGSDDNWVKAYVRIGDGNPDGYYWVDGMGKDDSGNIYDDGTNYTGYRLKVGFGNPFTVLMKGAINLSGWSDLITSIDIFASSPIYAPNQNATFESMDNSFNIIFNGMSNSNKTATIESEVLSKGQFYRIMSISTSDTTALTQLGSGDKVLTNTADISGDALFTHATLPETYRDGNTYIPINGTTKYNDRLLLLGATEILTHGEAYLNGQVLSTSSGSPSIVKYVLRYKIVDDNDGSSHYVMAYYNGGTSTDMKTALEGAGGHKLFHGGDTLSDPSGYYYPAESYAWICYPDSRCTEVEISRYFSSGSLDYSISVPLKPHPYLECAYAFFGFGKSLAAIETDYSSITASTNQSATISLPNKLFASEFQNPYKFPAEGIVTFGDAVLGAATTSVPLSEGQMGQFPLYVFTAGGIRTLDVNRQGSFYLSSADVNLARHIAIKGTILGLEQSVVFTTEKGVMLLTGRNVQCISEVMDGKPYYLSGDMSGALSTHINTWAQHSVLSDLGESTAQTFMSYMKSAVPMYDAIGGRLIFTYNGLASIKYHYVYMLRTATWHKMSKPAYSVITPLNSFPECQAAVGGTVYDYSTVLDSASLLSDTGNERAAVIVTRPLDLGEPDVRKAIRSIRIRGRYKKNHIIAINNVNSTVPAVQYVLLGSLDGNVWKIMSSLRGGSYKWYRVVLLLSLSPTERISWIDIDYEPRMLNRLR